MADLLRTEFHDLFDYLKLDPTAFDWVIVADGSGTKAERPCGYYSAVYDVCEDEVEVLRGALSHGTNNFSELAPLLHALWWLETKSPKGGRVLFVTDSEVTAKCGMRQYSRNFNRGLWASLDYYESVGFRLHFRWVPRATIESQIRADHGSRDARLNMQEHLEDQRALLIQTP